MAMNDGDVYVLDSKNIIYVWTGRNSNNVEKLQGAKVCIWLCVCATCTVLCIDIEKCQSPRILK